MKKYKRRKFIPGECLHIYQRTIGGVNVFYDREDFLVFFTVFSVISKLYSVTVLELCLMIDHIHILLSSDIMSEVSAFIRHYTSLFVHLYNQDSGRTGPLFHKSFGSAPKKGSKKIRSTIVYIGNNPVEKNLCAEAPFYRWNFLAYTQNDFPYSQYIQPSKCPPRIRVILKEVRDTYAKNSYLSYAQLRRMFDKLSVQESEYVTDYIVKTYYPFDSEALLSFYDTYEDMISAMKSTAGSDHDIKEKYYAGSDCVYRDMLKVVRDEMRLQPARKVIVLNKDLKFDAALLLQRKTTATTMQISKFLHMKILSCPDIGLPIIEQ